MCLPMPADDIPFDRNFDLPPDTVEQVTPGLRRIMCNNPGPMTFKGTVSRHTGALDEATRSLLVEADFANGDLSLRPGMYASIKIGVEMSNDAAFA